MMKRLLIFAAILFSSIGISAQSEHEGSIVSLTDNEILVKNDTINTPFIVGEKLQLQSGNQSIILEVTFPMQTVTKCRLVSGNRSVLRPGMAVHSVKLSSTQKTITQSPIDKRNQISKKEFIKPITLTFWHQGDRTLQVSFERCISAFNKKYPAITINLINYDPQTSDIRKAFSDAPINGGGPDIVFGTRDNLDQFVTNNLITPIPEIMGEEFLKNFTIPSLVASKCDDKFYMIPAFCGNSLFLIYNKALVSSAPKTWDEMIEMANTLRKEWKVKHVIAFNENEPFFSLPMLGAFGGKIVDEGTTKKQTITLDTPQVKAWMQWLYEIHRDGQIPEKADYDDANTLFEEGKIAFIINGPWSITNYTEAYNMNIGVAPIPQINGKWPVPYYFANGYSISRSVLNNQARKEACRMFLEYISNKESQLELMNSQTMLPTNCTALQTKAIGEDPLIVSQLNLLEKSCPVPFRYTKAFEAIKSVQKQVLDGSISAEDAPSIMQRKAEEETGTIEN